ncbi:MAG: hypothetical protein AAB573_02835 [Patescibacteria group bacterium]
MPHPEGRPATIAAALNALTTDYIGPLVADKKMILDARVARKGVYRERFKALAMASMFAVFLLLGVSTVGSASAFCFTIAGVAGFFALADWLVMSGHNNDRAKVNENYIAVKKWRG